MSARYRQLAAHVRHLPYQRTLGGHRRSPEPAIRQLAASLAQGVRAS